MEFDAFWIIYPRKMSKKDALKAWNQCADQELALEALPIHVQYWEATTTREYIPYPATWLRGERYHDEIELPRPKEVVDTWWTSEAGILAKGKELGLLPRPGEDMFQYKGRLNEAIRSAA